MASMDPPKANQPSSLDSLRTVEFRQTLRGYHIDDVDEYLERVAVEAEALQEQFRQSNDRVRQAADRIAQLEQALAEAKERLGDAKQKLEAAPPQRESAVSDETLQRTLLMAQQFVDQTKADAELQARSTIAQAEERARSVVAEAEAKARSVMADNERNLRDEVGRLESQRSRLSDEVGAATRHIEEERNRLRGVLGEMLTWVDKNFQPGAARPQRHEERPLGSPAPQVSNGPPGQSPADRGRSSPPAPAPMGGFHRSTELRG
jgi:cell division initiation protein